ncbi:MAG TPA: hypothetical protein PKB11_09835 [Desulfovibrio sp.]|jgi:hypothetical protein|uniref:hypothetical protein n=1 Tax=Desulfovibrio TaxID=872 RepID=UPI00040C5ADA|nr:MULTISPECIES: hypothetical protein [Desulfovibrio]MDY0304993.1 hypothetical protein [Desulfovibrionaceae bacterium]HMM39043.1 hypothetical protein [Desulfovibrio sp.]
MSVLALGRQLRPFGGHQASRVCIICGLLFEPRYAEGCAELEEDAWVCSRACRDVAFYDYRDECADLDGLRARILG